MAPRLSLLLALLLAGASSAQQQYMEYMDRRFGALEERISQWHDQSSRYSTELREFKNQVITMLENMEKEQDRLRTEVENTAVRVDRLEREVDYLETQNPAPPCVEVDEKLMENQVSTAKKRKNEKYDKLTDCSDTISQVKAMKILKKFGSSAGLWTKDPVGSSEKIYVFDGSRNDTVYVFPRMREFTLFSATRKAARIKLPYPWVGTGHLVYGGHLYYIRQQGTFQVIKFSLANKTIVDSSVFPAEEQVPVFGLSAFNYIDIAADEEGLWAIYATRENEKNICLAKLDPVSLDIEQMWDTPCPRENAESAFVICGALYVVYNTRLPSRSRVQCVFDVSGAMTPEDAALVYFPKRYGSHSSMKYNPKERQIYAWDDGYQIIYRMEMKKKLEI
ncbi:olfactomedin-like protein 3 [Trachemys scripta elegans]|uniref:olfactomedin-like protein 3 n=1 Tax=Chrysemys picta bellii TaxID=8478 RepID=UPI00155210C4|nr:olfactomedin-like protein 3 [Trachemys scripta elegans]XP_053881930.1 olfactomedin-like protein 3 [Malaclemys terrapin pileata]